MNYYTKITTAGLAAITAAMNNSSKVPITYMAFGDGNGAIPEPDENSTSLINEVYRVVINKVEVHNKNPNWLVCEAIIPSAVGGFNIREVALYDDSGTKMLAVANYPPTYKPSFEEGAAKIQTIRIILQVDNSGTFELVVDPNIVLATKADLEVLSEQIVPTIFDNEFQFQTDVLEKAKKSQLLDHIEHPSNSKKFFQRVATASFTNGVLGSRYYCIVPKNDLNEKCILFELRRGVTTTTQSLGIKAELLRITSIFDILSAWVGRHGYTAISDPLDWNEQEYLVSGSTQNFSTGVAINKYYQSQGIGLKNITFNTYFDNSGHANLLFLSNSGSTTDCNIYIDDVLYKTVNLKSATLQLFKLDLLSSPGYHSVKVERPSSANGAVNVFGCNYYSIKDAKKNTPYDGMYAWSDGFKYTSSEGSNDYALIEDTTGLFGGSYHGGEILNNQTFSFDGVALDPQAGIQIFQSLEIFQDTSISWGEGLNLNVKSFLKFDQNSSYKFITNFIGPISSKTFYNVMHCTPNSFTQVYLPNYMDLSSQIDGFKKLARGNLIHQVDPVSKHQIFTEFSLIDDDEANKYGSAAIRKVSGSYNKVYYGPAIDSENPIQLNSMTSYFKKLFI